MNDLVKAIEVGEYPAPCFQEFDAAWDHRRFLRFLANSGAIHLRDEAGHPLDLFAVMNGSAQYHWWYVDRHDAQVITQSIQEETRRREEERERRRKELEEEKERAARRKRERVAELKAAGLWTHPLYKTLTDARADGWHKPKQDEYGGEEITLKGHTLVRNTKMRRYVYKTTLSKVYGLTPAMIGELGRCDKTCDNPHYISGPPASLYDIDRVEAWIEKNQDRVNRVRESRDRRAATRVANDSATAAVGRKEAPARGR
jgi:hypothetical protein